MKTELEADIEAFEWFWSQQPDDVKEHFSSVFAELMLEARYELTDEQLHCSRLDKKDE